MEIQRRLYIWVRRTDIFIWKLTLTDVTFILLSDGIGRTGVFCALCIVLERMRSEGVVDLFQTVKLLRTQRPNMIQNQVRAQWK